MIDWNVIAVTLVVELAVASKALVDAVIDWCYSCWR